MTPVAVSVVLPTQNRRPLLARALASVLAQEDVDCEAVVVDDGSTDDTSELLASWPDKRLRSVYLRHPRGVATARNVGVEQATGCYVAFIDDDDLWAPTKLRRQLRALAKTNASWSSAGAVVLNERLHPLQYLRAPNDPDLSSELLRYNVIPGGCSGVVVRRSVVLEVGGFDPALSVLADWDLWIRLGLSTLHAGVDEPVVGYVRHQANMTARMRDFWTELDYVAAKYEPARAGRGVDVDRQRWTDWEADTLRRSGERLGPAAAWARSALSGRSPRLLARAGIAAAWPGWVHVRDRQRARTLDREWSRQAEAWLLQYRRRQSGARP